MAAHSKFEVTVWADSTVSRDQIGKALDEALSKIKGVNDFGVYDENGTAYDNTGGHS